MSIADNREMAVGGGQTARNLHRGVDPTKSAFFWLCGFFIVYCTRFEDFIPGLQYIPWGKITAIMAAYGLFKAAGKTKRTFKDLPKMANLLLYMIIILYLSAFTSPIWKGGAVLSTTDFAKIYICWVLIFLIITTFDRLRKIIFIQAFSVVLVCAAVIIKGHDVPRLNQVLGGFYGNPNDLAFAVVLSLPYALAFCVMTKNTMAKAFWFVGMLLMSIVIFLTASRAGFIDLVCSYSVAVYYVAIKGKRPWIIIASVLLGAVIVIAAGGTLYDRFVGNGQMGMTAEGSFEDRKFLMLRAVDAIEHYPLLGIGVKNFPTYSGIWHTVHMTYLQIAAEGGLIALALYLMFFYRDFQNMFALHRRKDLDSDEQLIAGALIGSQVGFVVGALFAPEAYHFFPYFAAAFTVTLLQLLNEKQREGGFTPPPPKKPRHFLEVYADHRTHGAVSPVR